MYKYTNEFINIEKYDKDKQKCDYFKLSKLTVFENYECKVKGINNFEYFFKPYIFVNSEYYELTNLFKTKINNGLVCNKKIKGLYLGFSFNNIFDNNFIMNFNLKSSNNIKLNLLFCISLIDFKLEKLNKYQNCKNIACFRLSNNFGEVYLVCDNVASAYFNKIIFGKKIKKNLQDNVLYLMFDVTNILNAKILFFDSKDNLERYFNLGENYYIKSVANEYPKIDICSSVTSLDLLIDKLVINAYKQIYYSYQTKDNISFRLSYLITIDKRAINLINKYQDIDSFTLLHFYLKYYLIYGECFSTKINELIYEVNKNLSSLLFINYEKILDLYLDINAIIKVYKIEDNLLELYNRIVINIKDINFALIINSLHEKFSVDKAIFLYKCKDFLLKHQKTIIDKIIIQNQIYDNKFINYQRYYELLYYLYEDKNKDIIFDKLLQNNKVYLEKLAIITDKIIGINIKNMVLDLSPKLPKCLDKIAVNFALSDSFLSLIIKKDVDTFIVNDVKQKGKKMVRIKKGYCKIICSN